MLIAEYQQDIDAGKMESKDVIGIITPFKGQALLIKKELINSPLAKQMSNMSVGTVHTFQGAERRIILFSTVYGSGENCYFIDKDESMMNVAVSRAKDAFIVLEIVDVFRRERHRRRICWGILVKNYKKIEKV